VRCGKFGHDDPVTEHLERPLTESVWDYPRPPAVVGSTEHVVVELGGAVIADSRRTVRVLETSHPPVYYIPREDIAPGLFSPTPGTTYCEFKGTASYFDLVCPNGHVVRRAAWHYPAPTPEYAALTGMVAFYPGRVDRGTVDGQLVVPQEGDFYGGWVTDRVTGPFKGAPGTTGW
jgi:uncharacterized protein (DUF427 family)